MKGKEAENEKEPFPIVETLLTIPTLVIVLILGYFVITNIQGPLPTGTLPTQPCGGLGPDCGSTPLTFTTSTEVVVAAGIITAGLYLYFQFAPIPPSNFATFWEKVEGQR